MTVKTLYLYTESATHAGTGTGLGAVDLPIQREKTTDYPMIQGSGVKGALRSATIAHTDDVNIVFGPKTPEGEAPKHAGAAAFGDARILLFPVRALNGVFVWTTSEDVLARFVRDCRPVDAPGLPGGPEKDTAWISNSALANKNKVVLEEYLYEVGRDNETNTLVQEWAHWLAENALPFDDGGVYDTHYYKALHNRLVILPDNDFRDFTQYATQVVTRVALDDETKTVSAGPFTVELLPADTLLYVPITAQKPREISDHFTGNSDAQSVLNWLATECLPGTPPPRCQIGGDETVGYGRIALRWGA